MFVKVLALCLILGICLAHPFEDSKLPVPIDVPPPNAQDVPANPSAADSSDLKTDSTFWHPWYQPIYSQPIYDYYFVPSLTTTSPHEHHHH